jgi:hypothetical protein
LVSFVLKTYNKNIENWGDFETHWLKQFTKVKSALKLLNLYPERLHLVGLGELLRPEQLELSQKDWIRLYNKLDSFEKDYFKPYHVPINSDEYKIFIDLSDNKLPLFEPFYHYVKQHHWSQYNRFESIMEVISYLDSDSTKRPVIDKGLAEKLDELIVQNITEEDIKKMRRYLDGHRD